MKVKAKADAMQITEIQLSLLDLAEKINQEHELCERSFQSALLHAKQAGDYLLEARTRVESERGKRKFKPWLEENFQFSRMTAYNYMRLAENWEEIIRKTNFNDDIPYKHALALLSESKDVDEEDCITIDTDSAQIEPVTLTPEMQALKADIDACHTWLHRASAAINQADLETAQYWINATISKLSEK